MDGCGKMEELPNVWKTHPENTLQQLNDSGVVYEICGMLWMQGESDAGNIEKAQAYENNLPLLFDDVRKQTGKKELPIVMGRIS